MINHFSVTLPGQPPSVNHTYTIARKAAKDRNGQPVFDREGSQKTYTSLIKKATVKQYQADIQLILQAAKPTAFRPTGMVYVVYDLYVNRDIDADNTAKAINDTLSLVLGVNDKMFLTVARYKESGVKEPYVRLTILDASAWKVEMTER